MFFSLLWLNKGEVNLNLGILKSHPFLFQRDKPTDDTHRIQFLEKLESCDPSLHPS